MSNENKFPLKNITFLGKHQIPQNIKFLKTCAGPTEARCLPAPKGL